MNRTPSMWFHSSLVAVIVALAFAAGAVVGFVATRSYYTPKNGVHPSPRVIVTARELPEPTPRVRTNGKTEAFSF